MYLINWLHYYSSLTYEYLVFKPGAYGRRPHTPSFSKSFLFARRYVCMCVSVCLPPRPLITSGVILCDTGCVWFVKSILQLFSLLPSINWMGGALVTQRVMQTRPRYRNWRCTVHGRRHISYLAVATKQSASIIKVNRRMLGDKFKSRIGFSLTAVVLA